MRQPERTARFKWRWRRYRIMNLDLPTLMVMQSFALACAGGVMVFAWSQDRTVSVLALWGVRQRHRCRGHSFADAGVHYASARLVGDRRHPAAIPVGLDVEGCADNRHEARSIRPYAPRTGDRRVWPVRFLCLRDVTGSLSLIAGAVYSLGVATTLWLGRKERLAARWPLIILSAVHAGALFIGTYSTFNGSTSQDVVPSVTSLFGFIYFESIIFALGTSVFIYALVKERNEAAGRTAGAPTPLTGIANRAAFLESAGRVLERCRRDGAPVSAMMFDLDRFKAVNDRHGHAIGDAVIRKFCEIMTAALRPNDVFGRIGGEEFAVVLPGSSIEVCLRPRRADPRLLRRKLPVRPGTSSQCYGKRRSISERECRADA